VRLRIAALITLAIWAMELAASTCVAPKAMKVSGAVCGKVFDISGASVPNVDILLADTNGAVVSRAHSDSNADFSFPSLPKGAYRVTPPAGYRMFAGAIEVTSSRATRACKRPVYVYLGVGDCSGFVSKKKPGR
jgi:hypothetical protein